MTVTPGQLDAHLKSLKGKANYWPGIRGMQCMVIFASVNQLLGGPAYSAPGAKDLWDNPALYAGYTQISRDAVPRFGDIAIHDETWGDGWGHITVVVENLDANSFRGFGQNPGVAATTTLGKNGLRGYLRPKALAEPAKPVPAPPKPTPPPAALVNRTVTQNVAWVRVAPNAGAALAPGLPDGLARGAVVSVKGYVSGQDPFDDGVTDDAWYVTRSGYYLWANAAGNSLAGLRKL